ncbi:MAG: hypothetical protein CME63_05950 [Halobacteriovoraceae bacterium]|nr:hypothetical protein [Halobacteriovoraceae bacterium]|tara:strand:+ start:9648 stop:10442 length:795 start_codon:yes stop_codon:yes gene_type:complete
MDHYHNERPALFRYSDSFKYKESQLHLYLEVDKKEKVSGFYYKWDGRPYFLAEFSDYAKKIEGAHLNEPVLPSDCERWSPVFFFYRRFIQSIKEPSPPISVLKGKDPQELICRCSAVYESEIRELICQQLDNEVYDAKEVYHKLESDLWVAVGCASCKLDVESLVREYIQGEESAPEVSQPSERDMQPEIPRWQSLDSQTLARESFTLLKGLSSQINSELRLLGTRPGSILIKSKEALDEEKTSSIQVSFDEAFGVGLEVQIKN